MNNTTHASDDAAIVSMEIHTLMNWTYQCHIQEFCSGGGFQLIQLRIEDRDLGVVAPYSGVLKAAVISKKKFHFI